MGNYVTAWDKHGVRLSNPPCISVQLEKDKIDKFITFARDIVRNAHFSEPEQLQKEQVRDPALIQQEIQE
jgi:hypothetical protein